MNYNYLKKLILLITISIGFFSLTSYQVSATSGVIVELKSSGNVKDKDKEMNYVNKTPVNKSGRLPQTGEVVNSLILFIFGVTIILLFFTILTVREVLLYQ